MCLTSCIYPTSGASSLNLPQTTGRKKLEFLCQNMNLSHDRALASLMFLILIIAGTVEQSQGRSCDSTFFSALVQLIPCRGAVSPFTPIPPTETCCSAIRALGQPCLCVLVNGPPISGVDRSMALQLPDKCATNFNPCES